ncbi:MAG: type I-U CRISPR-associated protein Csx17 [Xanthomonadales bacterium]|nr:type I-U CRISPR-associated protein Csx17 [Xanthomonadales bacterium]
MSNDRQSVDWSRTTFDGSRREQLRRAAAMSVRQRLEALDQLTGLAERMQAMPRNASAATSAAPVREPEAHYSAQQSGQELVLTGCAPTPLAGYLKALGVLRLLSSKYPDTRGFWRGDDFVLRTPLDRAGVESFFLHDYMPTPIMAPWNGGSGFYEKDNKVALTAVLKDADPRFDAYRACLAIAEAALAGVDRAASPKGDDKAALLMRIRSSLPDAALGWFDASVLLAGDSPQYPPLLGTGGNDGRLDFTNNFMQRLLDVLGTKNAHAVEASRRWLATTLFDQPAPGLASNAIGQFSPGQAGGPNAGTGFEADAAINPWDFVLMIEGALPFAAATVRRNADDPFGVLSYPFTVRAVGAGAGSLGEGDAVNARGELWMPLWSQAATYAEVHALMAEGRVAFGRKPARDALDFVRAVHQLGGYRGVSSFQRFGLLMRSGKAYLATPLSRVTVSDEPQVRWLDELDRNGWLERFRRYAQGDNIACRYLTYRRQLEDRLFEFSGREPSKAEAQSLLILLGQIQSALSDSMKARESIGPVPRLSELWISAADDHHSPAFRIAKALAGLRGTTRHPLPLRAQLFPVHRHRDQWMTLEAGENYRICSGQQGRLIDTLRTLLERRLWLADMLEMDDKPLESRAGVELDDIRAFLIDDHMDARIAELLPGLSLCRIPEDTSHSAGPGMIPAAFALLKLSLTPNAILQSLQLLPERQRMALPAGLPAQLAAGNHGNRAVVTAWRRLRTAGLAPLFTPDALPTLAAVDPLRACAALLIPLRYGATAVLARSITQEPETDLA